MNPLDNYPQIRRVLYAIQWLVNGVLTLAGAYFLISQTAPDDLPHWYVYTLALAPVLWTYLGITAQTNVTPSPTPIEPPPGPDDPFMG